jgi:hypothetical protein
MNLGGNNANTNNIRNANYNDINVMVFQVPIAALHL